MADWLSDKPKKGFSQVAGILDQWGGFRVVVAPEWSIHVHHVNMERDERAWVVPNMHIKEPVPWDYIPTLISRTESYIRWWQETRNDPTERNDYRVALWLMRHADGTRPPRSLVVEP